MAAVSLISNRPFVHALVVFVSVLSTVPQCHAWDSSHLTDPQVQRTRDAVAKLRSAIAGVESRMANGDAQRSSLVDSMSSLGQAIDRLKREATAKLKLEGPVPPLSKEAKIRAAALLLAFAVITAASCICFVSLRKSSAELAELTDQSEKRLQSLWAKHNATKLAQECPTSCPHKDSVVERPRTCQGTDDAESSCLASSSSSSPTPCTGDTCSAAR